MSSTLAASPRLRIEWGRDFRGRQPALDWLNDLDDIRRKRMDGAIRYVVNVGREHSTRERLSSLHNVVGIPRHIARQLWILRGDRFLRIIGCFRSGGVFLALHGVDKRRDEYEVGDLMAAARVMNEHDAQVAGSLDFIRERVPKPPRPTFRPTIVPPPEARPDPTPPARPVELFPAIEQEHVWAFVDRRDLMPPHAPLLQSLCRLPTYHNVVVREHLLRHIEERRQAMPLGDRLAFGLLDDGQSTVLGLGAVWAVEFLTARTLDLAAVTEPDQHQLQPVADAVAVEAPMPTPDLFWLLSRAEPGHGRKRYLAERIGDARSRTSAKTGVRTPKVLSRTYLARAHRWSHIIAKPAEMFTAPAALDDPLVVEAMRARSV
jgi:hypothetical protein